MISSLVKSLANSLELRNWALLGVRPRRLSALSDFFRNKEFALSHPLLEKNEKLEIMKQSSKFRKRE